MANSRNAAVQVTGETLGDNTLGTALTTTRTYDTLFRPSTVQSTGGGPPVHQLSYVYDELGNVTQRTDHVESVTDKLIGSN